MKEGHGKNGVAVLLFAIVYSGGILEAQTVRYSFMNSLRYGTGKEIVGLGDIDNSKEYLDNISDLRVYIDDLTIGFRNDFDNPPEYGLQYNGIRKKYIEYNNQGLNIRAGDLYALYEKGLALNLFEDKALGYDTGLEGVRLQYKSKLFSVSALGGEINYVDPATVMATAPRFEYYTLRGANTEVSPIKMVTVGGSFIWTEARFPSQKFDSTFDETVAQIPEFSVRLRLPYSLDVFASYAKKINKVQGVDSTTGSGLYASASQTGDGYGVTFEYKDYRFDVVDPGGRLSITRPTKMFPFQNPPIVTKEHSFTLLSRYPHIVDFNDEVGFQLDGYVAAASDITLNLNCSMASRHYEYVVSDPMLLTFRAEENNLSFLPSFSDKRSPFWEIYADVDYYFVGRVSYFEVGFDRRNEVIFDDIAAALGSEGRQPQRSVAVPFLVQYAIDERWSLKLTSEQQWVTLAKASENNCFYNQLVSLELAHSPDVFLGMTCEITTNTDEPGGRSKWFIVDIGGRIMSSHTVTLSYGSERGGQVCSNGICRIVLPFTGFRLSVLSNI